MLVVLVILAQAAGFFLVRVVKRFKARKPSCCRGKEKTPVKETGKAVEE
jgi:hypothetical protein